METRIQRFFLTAVLVIGAMGAMAAENGGSTDTGPYDPNVERRVVKTGSIDTENYEFGWSYGILSIEDFGSHEMESIRFNYHVNEDIFLQTVVGRSKAGLSSYDRLSGGGRLLTDSESQYRYYSLSLGVNVLPGQTFISENWSFNSTFYVLAGAGNTHFANDDRFTFNLGAGYQFIFFDWLTAYIEGQDHLFDIDVTGVDKRTNNIEFSMGFSAYF